MGHPSIFFSGLPLPKEREEATITWMEEFLTAEHITQKINTQPLRYDDNNIAINQDPFLENLVVRMVMKTEIVETQAHMKCYSFRHSNNNILEILAKKKN